MIFPGSKVSLTGWLFSGFFFWPFLKRGASFAFLQPPGLSPDFHDLSKMIESGPARILDIFLITHGCSLPGTMVFYGSSSLK